MRKLFDAAVKGQTDIVLGLLSDVEDGKKRVSLSNAALRSAAAAEHDHLVKLLLDHDASPNRKDGYQLTALMYAAMKGHASTARVLLMGGADPNVRTARGITALMLAAGNNRPDVVRVLLQCGADPRPQSKISGETALMMASRSGCLDAVVLLIDMGVSTEDKTVGGAASGMVAGLTALMFAAANGQSAVVDYLLSHGADANAIDENGHTSSWCAAQKGDAETIALFVEP